ncbi:hypothetical protein DL89DRAFT_294421 [Linderina pennispora]|uniref:Uncharacterized protein n=1 Tax=Linderina pennispora TaxID=61395 RepID=A0A1Y1W2W2_9FUNG|nr:uncharacterized protein DL89DRAFT_294421 [Linderina pennispora]ORX67879.1 hypothetical protein DL89DRAFT_294421 [Linderina pennispora]
MLTSPLLRVGRWSAAATGFMAVCLVQATVNIAFSAHFIARLRAQAPDSQYIVYDSGCIAAQVFAAALAYGGLHVRSFPLVTTATAFDVVLAVFRAAQLAQAHMGVAGMQAASIAVTLVGCAAKAYVESRWLRREFGWQVYRALGADRAMQRMFLLHQVLLSVSILGAAVFVEFWLLVAVAQADGWLRNVFILVLAAVLITMVLFAAVQELPWVMRACAAVLIATPVYFIYMLVAVNRQERYRGGRKYLSVMLTVLVLLDSALAMLCIAVCRTFNRGLRQRLRRFQIMARGEVDLAAVSKPAADRPEKPPHALTLRFRIEDLDAPIRSAICSVRSEHRDEVRRWEILAPGIADPELVRSFVSDKAVLSRSAMSDPLPSSVGSSVSCVLSAGELAAAAPPSTLSSFPSASFSAVTNEPSFVGTRDFEDDKALYDTLQRPLELRVTNPDVRTQKSRLAPSTVSSSTDTLRTALSSLQEDPDQGFDVVSMRETKSKASFESANSLPPPAYFPSTSK